MAKLVLKENKGAAVSLSDLIKLDKPIPLRIGYIGGGSRGWAHALMKDLATCTWFKGEIKLYDIDHKAAAFNARFGNHLQQHPENKSKWKYRAVRRLSDAVKGCDFVFTSIQPGPIHFMKHDLEIPMKYGIYQPVGDTVGPGGVVRGFRSARIYKAFAEAIAQYNPKAWVINFTNPMTVCTRTLYAVYPDIKAFGCCHEVFGGQGHLARLFARKHGGNPPPRSEIQINVLGINHFTWINKAVCRGVDLLDLLREDISKPSNMKMYTKAQIEKDIKGVFGSKGRVRNELMHRYDVMAAAGDRHLAEFVPWFLTDKNSCYRWGFKLTPYTYRITRWNDAPKRFRRQLAGKEPIRFGHSGEEYINQMAALLGLANFRTNVNLPNRGQMGKIPMGAVVESNALFSRDSVEPIVGGSLPDPVNALIYPHVINQESTVKAVLEGDEDLGFRAFANDPLCHRLPLDQCRKMFKQMLRATKFKF